jgi:hypothetical protein
MEKPPYENFELVNRDDPDILRIQNPMKREEISIKHKETESDIKYFNSANEFLTAFENSETFEEILKERAQLLIQERPDLVSDHQMLIEGTRMSESYRDGIVNFYKDGNRMNGDLNVYPKLIKKSIEEYLKCLKDSANKLTNPKYLSLERDDKNRGKDSERYRDKLHNEAAIDLLGGRIRLGDGTILSTNPNDQEASQILDPLVFLHVGRRLVHLIAVDRGIDQLDVDRERNKIRNARLKYGFGTRVEDT